MALLRARRPSGSYEQRTSTILSTSQLQHIHATMAASVAKAHGHFLNAIFVMPVLNPSSAMLLGKGLEKQMGEPGPILQAISFITFCCLGKHFSGANPYYYIALKAYPIWGKPQLF